MRGKEGTAGKAAPPTTRAAAALNRPLVLRRLPQRSQGGPGCGVRSFGSVLGSAFELTLR